MNSKKFYLSAALFSALVPWSIYGAHLYTNGFSLQIFFANGAVAAVTVELLMINLVFLVWSYVDSAKHGLRKWWLISILSYAGGCAVPLPIYLYFRCKSFEKKALAKLAQVTKEIEIDES